MENKLKLLELMQSPVNQLLRCSGSLPVLP